MIHSKDKIHKTLFQVYEDVLHAENKFKIASLKNSIVFGLVIDASTPKKTRTNDYMQQIKIIDQTVNFAENQDNPKYLHIFLFSNTLEELLTINNLGDVIYMKRFDLQGMKNKFHTSKIMLISGQLSGPTLIKQIKPDKFQLSQLTSDDESLINELKEWGLSYFSQYPISQQSWREQSKDNEYYDLLLRVTNIYYASKDKIKKVTFENNHAEVFTMMVIEDEDLLTNLQVGQVIKLRNTKICPNNLLQSTECSILFIPNYFHDSANFVNQLIYENMKIINLNNNIQNSEQNYQKQNKVQQEPTKVQEEVEHIQTEQICKKTNQLLDIQDNMIFEGMAEIYDCSYQLNDGNYLLIFCLRDESLEGSQKFVRALTIITPENLKVKNKIKLFLKTFQKILNLDLIGQIDQQLENISQKILEASLDETFYNFEIHQLTMTEGTVNKIVKFNNECL